jgi:hypothetical protein
MGRMFGFIVILIVVAIGGYVYVGQMHTLTPKGSSPNAAIAVTAVRNDLISIANAERRFFATNGKYATIDDLRLNDDISVAGRAEYAYTAEISDTDFEIIANYSGTDRNTPKRIRINGAMQITID